MVLYLHRPSRQIFLLHGCHIRRNILYGRPTHNSALQITDSFYPLTFLIYCNIDYVVLIIQLKIKKLGFYFFVIFVHEIGPVIELTEGVLFIFFVNAVEVAFGSTGGWGFFTLNFVDSVFFYVF